MNSSPLHIEAGWSLFLDRDGVINHRIVGDYVRNIEQLKLFPNIEKTIADLTCLFSRTFVVTNQQGIGKALMTEADVSKIHQHISNKVRLMGGNIDAFYFAPQLKKENHPMRKPGIGMALKAQEEFPEINFKKSIMVGDSESDILFGKNVGMKTVFIQSETDKPDSIQPDFSYSSLEEFANSLL
tara:strand:+ start:1023 stop:1574 length:552 start_codon:yes stop_codon:yes gene_type:complete